MKSKPCWALYEKTKLQDCYFAKSVAVREVDKKLGTGLFSPEWKEADGVLTKGDYTIVPCSTNWSSIFYIEVKRIHTPGNPTIFPSIDAVADILKNAGHKIKKKETLRTKFRITTDRGTLEGRMMQVK